MFSKHAGSAVRFRAPRKVLAIGACAASVALAAACSSGSSGSSASSSSSGTPSVTVAYVSTTADQMLANVTESAGLFKKYGVNVKVEFMDQAAFMPALESGQVQFGLVSAPAAALATINGSPNIWVAQFESALNLSLVANASTKTLKDLNGGSIAISSSGGSSDLLAQLAEQEGGISVKEVPLGNLQNDLTALESGKVDSAILGPPLTYELQSKIPGAHVLLDFGDQQDSLPGLGLVAYGSWLSGSGNGATTVKVLKAFVAGIQYYKSNPAAVEKIISKYSGTTSSALVAKSYQAAVSLLINDPIPATDTQQKLLNVLQNKYPAAKGFAASGLVDQTYMKEALDG
jgi:ABC-type nitrate/sulfonate/bicarbonate transport system substrate-binding protein